MNVLRIFAPLALCLSFAWAQSCDDMSCKSGCDSYYELCLETSGCAWDSSSDCASSDGKNEASCCVTATTTTTPAPTDAPTCEDVSGNSRGDPCYYLDEECCTAGTNSNYCTYSTEDLCVTEGGPGCCYMVTPEPTPSPSRHPTPYPSPSPTPKPSDEPTPSPSDEPTTSPSAEPTPSPSAEPTDSPSAEPTPSPSDEPTPSPSEDPTPSPTTTTTTTTTEAPTTPYPTTDAPTAEETSTTSYSYPTPRPTMKSARKWEMIHPQYKGGDGELLWHVYYGDFSDDERFDGFRKNELWDADVIRPMLAMDAKFERFATLSKSAKRKNKQFARQASVPSVAEVTSGSNSYAFWLAMAGVLLVAVFAYWYKFKSGDSKLFNNVEAKTLLNRTKTDECYVY